MVVDLVVAAVVVGTFSDLGFRRGMCEWPSKAHLPTALAPKGRSSWHVGVSLRVYVHVYTSMRMDTIVSERSHTCVRTCMCVRTLDLVLADCVSRCMS